MKLKLPASVAGALRAHPGKLVRCTLRGRDGVRWQCMRQVDGTAILDSPDLPGVTLTLTAAGELWEAQIFVRASQSLVNAQQAVRALEDTQR